MSATPWPKLRAAEPVYVPADDGDIPWADEPAIGARPRPHQAGHIGQPLADFLAEPDDPRGDDLVAGLLPRCGLAVLAGDPKAFKTLLGLQLALTVGRPDDGPADFLGHPADRGPVLVIEEEGSRSRLRERLRMMMAGLGYVDAPAVTVAMHSGLRLDIPRDRERLETAIAETGAVLVIGDPLIFLHAKDENRPSDMGPILRELAAIADRRSCCILLVHHLTKPSAERRVTRLAQRVRGAGAIAGGTDTNIVLDRDSGAHTARLQAEMRDGEDVDLTLELDVSTLLLRVIPTPVREGKIPEAALLEFVRESGQVTVREVMVRFGVRSRTTARAALDATRGLDTFEGSRGQVTYFLGGTGQ